MGTVGGRVAAGLVVLAVVLPLAACGSGSSAASANGSTTTVRPGTGATSAPSGTVAPATSAAPATTSSAALVPMQTATGGEFLSPSGNISCEVDHQRAGLTQAYCQTVTPPGR